MHLLPASAAIWCIFIFAAIGACGALYAATKIIEEARGALRTLVLLAAIVAEFVVFFAAEYWHLLLLSPQSFMGLPTDFISLLVHSLMMFVFNPIYLPGNQYGNIMLLVHISSAVLLILFILQNVSQIHHAAAPAVKRPSTRKKKSAE